MKKITELSETRYRTIREKDALGNRTSKKVPYTALRQVQMATNGKRFGHFLIDLVIIEAIAYTLRPFISQMDPDVSVSFRLTVGSHGIGPTFSFIFLAYYLLFEYFFQRTPGKFITKCRVIDLYGNKLSFDKAMRRTIIRIIPFEAFSCLGERGWHDRWSETFVVPDEEYDTLQQMLAESPE